MEQAGAAGRQWPARWWVIGALAFVIVATLNSAGYRFGTGDQAFYLPAIQRHLDPESFPRDRVLIDDQDRFNVFPRVAAAVIRAAHVPEPVLFAGFYALSLLVLFVAARAFGGLLGLSAWAQLAFLAALTLKHRVGLTGVNTLEGYAHPRMLAFALGLWAVVVFLRGKPAVACALVAAASVVHPTTACWFAVWIGVAILATARPTGRRWMLAAAGAAGVAVAWAVARGPLSSQIVRMDEAWLGVLAGKDYLLATRWPAGGWGMALLYVGAVGGLFALRRARGVTHPREPGLVLGLAALVALFLASLPFVAARLAFAVQLQVPRVFWMLDLTATAYAVWALADARGSTGAGAAGWRRAAVVAAILACGASARGAWVLWAEHPGRLAAQITLPRDDWQDAMSWLSRTPINAHILADPGHAWRYGTSVRVAAGRDVYLEEVKDTAMSMYSRRVATRVAGRIGALGDFGALTPDRARALAEQFALDYLVIDRALDLPLAYRNARFSIYRLAR